MSSEIRICFVCLGNIVRSPLAENMFLYLVDEAGMEGKYIVDSAGTGGWHVGEAPDPRMRKVAAAHGMSYNGRARQFQRGDFDRFDLIIAMDSENRDDLYYMTRSTEHRQKIHLLREFDPQGGTNASVPDPYYGGMDGFEEVYQVVERSCRGLLTALNNGLLGEKF